MNRSVNVPLVLTILLLLMVWPFSGLAGNRFVAIAWHDVVEKKEDLASDAVTIDHLVDQFEWLIDNGYHPISIDRLLAAENGGPSLPDKAVLLCWDDGYQSFHTRVLPLLRAYNFPAVLALVGSWMEPPPSATVRYGDNLVPRTRFLSWQQVREIQASGLVEIASHSWGLHRGVLADAAGDRLPAVIAHLYDPVNRSYESEQEQKNRILADLLRNSELIANRTGHRPRVMVWPFGRYNEPALQAAREAGMMITLTLDPVLGDVHRLRAVGRIYPTRNPELDEFRTYLSSNRSIDSHRFITVDSRHLIEAMGGEDHFSRFLDRLVNLQPDIVAFSPVAGDGPQATALFPSRFYIRHQDRLTRLTWHTARRGGSRTFLWLDDNLLEQPAAFYHELGRYAYNEGLFLDSAAVTEALIQMAGRTSLDRKPLEPLSWDPSLRRSNRQQWLRSTPTHLFPRVRKLFACLEAFQYWQPFLEIALVVKSERFSCLQPIDIARLLTWIDLIVVEVPGDGQVGLSPPVLGRRG